MKSTIEKACTTEVLENGEILVKYKATPSAGSLLGALVISALAALVLFNVLGGHQNNGTSGPIAFISFFAVLTFLAKRLLNKNTHITIVPKQGLKFSGQQVLFSDIQNLYTATNRAGHTRILLGCSGNEVALTEWAPQATTDFVVQTLGKYEK